MGYELRVDPPKCTITTSGGKSKHKLTNYCDKNLAYKIFFAPGTKYSVPADKMAGVIEIGKSIEIEITRQVGKSPDEDMTIEYCAATTNESDATKGANGVTGKTIVKLKSTE